MSSVLKRYQAKDQEIAKREKDYAKSRRLSKISDNYFLYNKYVDVIRKLQVEFKKKIAEPTIYEHEYVMQGEEKVLCWCWYMFMTNVEGKNQQTHVVLLESGNLVTVTDGYKKPKKVVNKIILERVKSDSPELLPEYRDKLNSLLNHPNGIKLNFRNMEMLCYGMLNYAEKFGIETFLYRYNDLGQTDFSGD